METLPSILEQAAKLQAITAALGLLCSGGMIGGVITLIAIETSSSVIVNTYYITKCVCKKINAKIRYA